ncbi:hypothetical protein [Candidatus Seribacter sulfatis]|mgnify:FL=1|uniref:hypothetical protein n=1 Tax=Candidatus Seribacter sulfatis TaxID=3381756 RepID=UPI0038998A05
MEKDKKQKKVDLSQLSDLDFAPNWDNKYIAGEKQKDRFKPQRQEHQREFKRKKKEIPKRYDSPFANKFKITVNPDKTILDTLKRGIRKSGISYSLEEINSAIIDKKNRLQITIEHLKEETFFITTFDNSVFYTKSNAINHIVEKGLKHVVDITETIGENPSGNFKNILKCPESGILLPPKSFHDFEAIIKTHLIEKKIKLNYNNYLNKLITVEDEITINEWKNTPLKKLIFTTRELGSTKRSFNSIEAVQGYISSTETNQFIKTNKVIKIKGDSIDNFEKDLAGFISDFLKNSYQWKKDLFFNTLINFKKSGFYIFKYGPKNYLFAAGQKPKTIEITKISENCVKIVKYIQKTEPIKIISILSQSGEMKLEKNQILVELKWLVKEGYVKEFSDGTIVC